ncbi:MAG: hypothetical protein Q7S40_29885 [Opitutaceae bacterium]|nr:hypothetical protein [Opitutaceae bacterium]
MSDSSAKSSGFDRRAGGARDCGRALGLKRALVAFLVFAPLGFAAELDDATKAMALAAEAATAAEAKDFPVYLEKIEAAVALRPDFPQLLTNLAAAQVANERLDDALATLERLAALGMTASFDKAEEFAALRGRKEFDAVVRKFANNAHPIGRGEMAFSLRDVTGLIEGMAWRQKTGEFFFSDVHERAVWRRNKDNTLRRFTPEGDELLGVFGLAVDEGNGVLWAATAAVPVMRGHTAEQAGTAALAEIDLETGAVRRTIAVAAGSGDQQPHLFGDVAVGTDGSVFVSDSVGGAIWRLAAGADKLDVFAQGSGFISPQGVVTLPDGGGLIVADRVNGFLRVEVPGGNVARLESPAGTTLIGIDGLALAAGGDLIAIQNSTSPKRVVRITLESGGAGVTSVTVLESGHLTMSAPSLGCIAQDGDFYFVGNAGWSRFDESDAKPTAPRPVPIFKTKIALPAAVKR